MKQSKFKRILLSKVFFITFLLVTSNAYSAQEYTHGVSNFPPVKLYISIDKDGFTKVLKDTNKFESIEDSAGTPLAISVILSRESKPTAGDATSGLLAASTLGLTPMTMNFVFSTRIALFAHRTLIFEKIYDLPRKETSNIWTVKSYDKLRDDEKAFINESLINFASELTNSPEAEELFKEYYLYFR